MKKTILKTFLLSIKENILPVFICIFTICLVIFSKSNLLASKQGLSLWSSNVVPSLLPFFIASELLSYTDIIYNFGKLLEPIMRHLFNVPGIGSYAFLMGIISGYPTGAKIVTDLKHNGLCTKVEAERLLAFTNNSGPLFILGTVGISLFGNSTIGFLLLFTHILACLSVAFLFRFYKSNDINSSSSKMLKHTTDINFSNLGEIVGKSIMSAVKSIVVIGGFVVLFSVILSILKNSNIIDVISNILFPAFKIFGINDIKFVNGFIYGIIELTNGIMQVSNIKCKTISINILIVSFLLGFGGLSVLMQVNSIVSKENISIKPYFIGKLLQGLLACIYTAIIMQMIPIFNLNL